MGLFGAITTAGSGLYVDRKWLDAVSDNIANVNTVRPTSESAFQARMVVADAVGAPGADTAGTVVRGIALGNATGRLVYAPGHPLADAKGYIRLPDIDLGDQMTQMIMAERGYQANLSVIQRAQSAYQQALTIGKP